MYAFSKYFVRPFSAGGISKPRYFLHTTYEVNKMVKQINVQTKQNETNLDHLKDCVEQVLVISLTNAIKHVNIVLQIPYYTAFLW